MLYWNPRTCTLSFNLKILAYTQSEHAISSFHFTPHYFFFWKWYRHLVPRSTNTCWRHPFPADIRSWCSSTRPNLENNDRGESPHLGTPTKNHKSFRINEEPPTPGADRASTTPAIFQICRIAKLGMYDVRLINVILVLAKYSGGAFRGHFLAQLLGVYPS